MNSSACICEMGLYMWNGICEMGLHGCKQHRVALEEVSFSTCFSHGSLPCAPPHASLNSRPEETVYKGGEDWASAVGRRNKQRSAFFLHKCKSHSIRDAAVLKEQHHQIQTLVMVTLLRPTTVFPAGAVAKGAWQGCPSMECPCPQLQQGPGLHAFPAIPWLYCSWKTWREGCRVGSWHPAWI